MLDRNEHLLDLLGKVPHCLVLLLNLLFLLLEDPPLLEELLLALLHDVLFPAVALALAACLLHLLEDLLPKSVYVPVNFIKTLYDGLVKIFLALVPSLALEIKLLLENQGHLGVVQSFFFFIEDSCSFFDLFAFFL